MHFREEARRDLVLLLSDKCNKRLREDDTLRISNPHHYQSLGPQTRPPAACRLESRCGWYCCHAAKKKGGTGTPYLRQRSGATSAANTNQQRLTINLAGCFGRSKSRVFLTWSHCAGFRVFDLRSFRLFCAIYRL